MSTLYELRIAKGLSQQAIADALQMSRVNYTNIENGKRNLTKDNALRLAELLGVSVDELFGRSEPQKDSINDVPLKYKKFPVYGFIACGDPEDMTDYIVDEEWIDDSVYEGRDICLCICRGNSMAPYIEDGDLVILDRNFDLVNGKIYAVQVNGEMATLKKVVKSQDGLDLIPLNPDYHKIHYSPKQCEQLPVRILGQLFRSTKRW